MIIQNLVNSRFWGSGQILGKLEVYIRLKYFGQTLEFQLLIFPSLDNQDDGYR